MLFPAFHCVMPYREPNSQYSSRAQGHSIADKTEYIKQLTALLESKDFRERIKGIDQLVADCQHNPSMVIHSLFPVGETPPPLVNAHYFTPLSLSCSFGDLFPGSPRSPRSLTPSKPACRSPTVRSTCTRWRTCRRSCAC